MANEFNAFSVATKGYACGLGTTGFFAFAIATKGYICVVDVVDRIKTRTHDRFNDLRDYTAQALREDEELLVICQGLIKIICR